MRKNSFQRGEILLVDLEPTVGREQKGHRPVFVLTCQDYNRLTGVPIVAPITNGGIFARNNGFSVNLLGTGLQTTGVIRCDQIRALDLSERKAKSIEIAPDYIIEEALEIVKTMFESEE